MRLKLVTNTNKLMLGIGFHFQKKGCYSVTVLLRKLKCPLHQPVKQSSVNIGSDCTAAIWNISRGHSEYANFVGFGTFRHFLQLLLPCANMSSPGGGGGMCILFEICKKTPIQKCKGGGGGGGSHFSA